MAKDTTPATEPAKAKRASICSKVYIDGEGDESRYPSPDTVACEMRFGHVEVDGVSVYGGAGVLLVDLSTVGDKCRVAAAWHGTTDKLANSYNKMKDAPDAYQAASDMLERLVEDEWTRPGEGAGPSTNLLVEAIVRCLEAEGEEVDATRKAKIRGKVQGKEARAATLANAVIKAAYEAIRAEQAAARAATAGVDAAKSEATLAGF